MHTLINLACCSTSFLDVHPAQLVSLSDEMDDWDAADVRPKQGRVENLLYLNDEDEEEGDDPEQEHEGRKVMVSIFVK